MKRVAYVAAKASMKLDSKDKEVCSHAETKWIEKSNWSDKVCKKCGKVLDTIFDDEFGAY